MAFSLLSSQQTHWELSSEGWRRERRYVTRTSWSWMLLSPFFPLEYMAFQCDCTHLRGEQVVTVRVTTKLAMLKLTNGWYSGCDEGFLRLCLHLLRQTNFEQTWRPGQVLRYNIWLACYREPELPIGRVFWPFSKSVAGPLLMTCQDKHCDTVGLHVSASPTVGWGCFSWTDQLFVASCGSTPLRKQYLCYAVEALTVREYGDMQRTKQRECLEEDWRLRLLWPVSDAESRLSTICCSCGCLSYRALVP